MKSKKGRFAAKKFVALFGVLLLGINFSACKQQAEVEQPTRDYVVYMKNGELFYSKLDKIEPKQLTEHFSDDENARWSRHRYGNMRIDYGSILFSSNPPMRTHEYYLYEDLYYRNLEKDDSQNELVDVNIRSYRLLPNDNVVYEKEDALYLWQNKESRLLAENIKEYEVSKDGQKVIYIDKKGNLCLREAAKDKEELLEENVEWIDMVLRDFSEVAFTKKEQGKEILYRKTIGKEAERLGENSYGYHIVDERDRHYLYIQKRALPLGEFVESDVKNGLVEQIKRLDDKYQVTLYDLWYFDENIFSKIDGEFLRWQRSLEENGGYNDKDFLLFNTEGFEKPKLSDFETLNDIHYAVHEGLSKSSTQYLFMNDRLFFDKEVDLQYVKVNRAGDRVRYYKNIHGGVGDLYERVMKNKELGEEKLLASGIDLGTRFISSVEDLSIYLSKSGKEYALYAKGEKVDEGIGEYIAVTHGSEPRLYYSPPLTNAAYSVKMYENGQVQTVNESVKAHSITPLGNFLYISDWDDSKGKGVLYYFDGKTSQKVDEHVSDIVSAEEIPWGWGW
ncbi:MAG: hypothetical protein Q4D65_08810 [Peptostreptococcaceae bacterium]|nr:hypothetical protein [Peptostreptococcaceae bacterium]